MKKLSLLVVAVFVMSGLSFSSEKANSDNVNFTVYYFHSSVRCATCKKLESYTEDAVRENFKKELASGKLIFKAINTDEDVNNHYISDYNLFTKSVIVSKTRNNKEENWKNLDKIWEQVRNKEKYYRYVSDEIKNFMKD